MLPARGEVGIGGKTGIWHLSNRHAVFGEVRHMQTSFDRSEEMNRLHLNGNLSARKLLRYYFQRRTHHAEEGVSGRHFRYRSLSSAGGGARAVPARGLRAWRSHHTWRLGLGGSPSAAYPRLASGRRGPATSISPRSHRMEEDIAVRAAAEPEAVVQACGGGCAAVPAAGSATPGPGSTS